MVQYDWKILDVDRYGHALDIKLFTAEINMDDRGWYWENLYFKHIRKTIMWTNSLLLN